MNKLGEMLVGVMVTATLLSAVPAQAGILGTELMLATPDLRSESLRTVDAYFAREQVQQQFAALGVAPEAAALRVAALSDSELQQLAGRIDQQPAGGDLLVVFGVVFVVLLITELLGVTNIFRSV